MSNIVKKEEKGRQAAHQARPVAEELVEAIRAPAIKVERAPGDTSQPGWLLVASWARVGVLSKIPALTTRSGCPQAP